MKVAIILKSPDFCDKVDESDVIYADGAYKHKDIIGEKNVLAVVGDFDSLKAAPTGENVIELNPEKNFTDGERAVVAAAQLGADEITVYGAYGGRPDHVLGNIALLKIAREHGIKAKIKQNGLITRLICGDETIGTVRGAALSIIPYGGDCSFVKSEGLYYPLNGLTLTPADTRGISNLATADTVVITVRSGEALVFYEQKK